jgi:hypothetical protein
MQGSHNALRAVRAAQSAHACGNPRSSKRRSANPPMPSTLSNMPRREFDNSFRLRAIMLVILERRSAAFHSTVRRIAHRRGAGALP